MKPVEASRYLTALPIEVFKVLSQPGLAAEVVPCVLDSEVLPGPSSGKGMRFRETRAMGKRRMSMEFEVTEWEEPSRLRVHCDEHGTVWDSTFRLEEREGGTELLISMDARAHKLMPRLMNPLMKPLFRKGLVQHLDALEAHFNR